MIRKKFWREIIPIIRLLFLGAALLLAACGGVGPRPGYNRVTGRTTPQGVPASKGEKQVGVVSYYGPGFHGKKTASGETFNQNDMTAAHQTLPFNTKVRVKLLKTGKFVVVRINDRGPFAKDRILDLSKGAAEKLGLIPYGTAKAEVVVLETGK